MSIEHVLPGIARPYATSTSTDVTVRTDGTNEESGSVQDQSSPKQRARTIGISSRWEQRMNENRANRYAVAS